MIDSRCRDYIQPTFDKLGRGMISLGLKANTLTCLAFFVGLLSAFAIGMGQAIWAIVFLWLSGLLDVLDGTVARLTSTSSLGGAYMDLIFDRMVEAAVILGFLYVQPVYHVAYIVFLIAVIFNFTTFMVAASLFKNTGLKSMHYDVGLAERTETFIVFTAMILFQDQIGMILMTFNAVIFITGLIRFGKVLQHSL